MSSLGWTLDSSVLFRIILAIILAGAIGLEREIHGRMAGLRTHVMVCLGATSLILAAEFSQTLNNGVGSVVFNPDRVTAGIITGIGFLGAGAILREENLVRGLTTAGCIWFVAALGIVIGKQFYALAICLTVAALIILILFRYIENWLPVLSYRKINIVIALENYEEVGGKCLKIFSDAGVEVVDRKLMLDQKLNEAQINYNLMIKAGKDYQSIFQKIFKISGVQKLTW
jgi:putative Mg2+ transporter-C (MgtC) family protein